MGGSVKSKIRITRKLMLQMIKQWYLLKGACVKTQGIVALDAVVFPLLIIDKKIDPYHWNEPIGIICFEKGREKEQVHQAVEIADKLYHLDNYEIWCDPDNLNDAQLILDEFPSNIRKKVCVKSLSDYYDVEHPRPVVILVTEVTSVERKDELVWELKFLLHNYGSVLVLVKEALKEKFEDIFQLLRAEGYIIQESQRKRENILYEIRKIKQIIKSDIDKKSHKINGKRSLAKGLEVQRKIIQELKAKGLHIKCSFKRGEPDVIVYEKGKIKEVVAIKSYTLDVTAGKGCRNVKGHKYVVSFKPSRDARAEFETAVKNKLNKIRLICVNLKTGNKIFDDFVGLNETVTLREYAKNFKAID